MRSKSRESWYWLSVRQQIAVDYLYWFLSETKLLYVMYRKKPLRPPSNRHETA